MSPYLIVRMMLALAVRLAIDFANATADDVGLEGESRDIFVDSYADSFFRSFMAHGIRAAFGLPDLAAVARNN